MSEEDKVEVLDKRRIKSVDDSCEDADEPDLDRAPSFVEKLKDDMEQNDARLREYIAAHKAKMAEIDQLRKRLEGEVEQKAELRFGDFLAKLFPGGDDFERAIEHIQKSAADDPALAGVVMLRDGLLKSLLQAGVELTDCEGKEFDPEIAQAVGTEPVEEERDNVVVAEVAAGFTYKGRTLRPALVRVGVAS